MTLRFARKREETPHRFQGLQSLGPRASSFPITCYLLPITAFALLAAVLSGCSKGGDGGNVSMAEKILGPSPTKLVAWAFDPNDPDRRRQGVVGLSSKDWGLKEPYLKGYAALLKTDKDPLVRAAAVRALGRAHDPNYAPDVTRALMDTDVTVRQDAATALDKVYDNSSAPALRNRVLNDVDQDVRANSCRALRHHRNIAVARALVDCLSDKAFSVRYQAHGSLVEIVGKDLGYDGQNWADMVGAQTLAPKAAQPDKAPWWDWMRVSKPAGPPATRPASAAPTAAPKADVVTPKAANPVAPGPPKP